MQEGTNHDHKFAQKSSYHGFGQGSKDRLHEEKSRGHNVLLPSSANERKSNLFMNSNDKKAQASYYADRALDNSKDIFLSKDPSSRVDYNLKVSYQDSGYTPKMSELRNAQRKAEEVSRSKENYHQTLENMLNSGSGYQNQLKRQQQQEYARRYAESKP